MENKLFLNNYATDFFVLRTPLLPLVDFNLLNSKIKGDVEFELISKEFKKIFKNKTLQESIYLASPALYYELKKFLQKDNFCSADGRLVNTLYSYYSRMCARSTPFGLFAGFSFGATISNESNLSIWSKSNIKRYCRLDMDYLCQLSNHIMSNKPNIRFIYTANSTHYEIGSKLRYIETIFQGRSRQYNIAQVDQTPLLKKLMKFSNEKTYNQLLSFLKKQGISSKRAIDYLNTLIDTQLLVNSLHAHVTGEEYMITLNKALHSLKFHHEARILDKVTDELTNLNEVNAVNSYFFIRNSLKKLSPDLDESKLFQMDLMKKAQMMTLDQKLITNVKESLQVLVYLNPKSKSKTRLDLFKDVFEERYETESVKLTDVLDAEIGINYEVLEASQGAQNPFNHSRITSFKLSKYVDSMKNGGTAIQLKESEIAGFAANPLLPNSFAAMIKLLGVNSEGSSIEVKFATGPSAANLLGRFCPADEKLNKAVKKILMQEEELDPDKIYAEIAHIPQARLGNVLTRPHLRRYEIPFLAQSKIGKSNTINIQDLHLKLVNNRLILYSPKHKKQVVTRLSTAHNFSKNNLQIYHFLCDLQFDQTQTSMGWNWDQLGGSEFLPRVMYKNCILSPAMWNIPSKKLGFLDKEGLESNTSKFLELKNELKLPDLVYLIEADNELLLDLNVSLSIQLIKKHFQKHKSVQFKENLFTLSELAVKDERQKGYANEIIIPFTKTKGAENLPSARIGLLAKNITRNFEVGSEWIYFKLYTGITTADMILRDYILPFSAELLEKKIIDKWFFIRYNDPKFHLRLRFHLLKKRKWGYVVQNFSKHIGSLLKTREINKYILDSYKREMERYGSAKIDFSETVFYLNSVTIGKLLGIYYHDKSFSPNDKLHVGIMAINGFIDSFGLTIDQKIDFLKHNRSLFAKEFNLDTDKNLKEQIQISYRSNKLKIESLLQINGTAELEKFALVSEVLSHEQLEIKAVINRTWLDGNASTGETSPILASFVHMYINRLMPANSRFNEFLIYENLERYYKSFTARKKAITKEEMVQIIS